MGFLVLYIQSLNFVIASSLVKGVLKVCVNLIANEYASINSGEYENTKFTILFSSSVIHSLALRREWCQVLTTDSHKITVFYY